MAGDERVENAESRSPTNNEKLSRDSTYMYIVYIYIYIYIFVYIAACISIEREIPWWGIALLFHAVLHSHHYYIYIGNR